MSLRSGRSAASCVAVLALGCGRLAFDPGTDAAALPDSTEVRDAALDPSLRLWLPFETGLTDAVAGASPACTSCPTLGPGRVGMAAVFDGTSCLRYPGGAPGLGSQVLTLSMWYRSDVTTKASVFGSPHDELATDGNSWELAHESGAMWFFTREGGVSAWITSMQVTVGQWHHVAATHDTATKRLYRDGVENAMVSAMPTAIDGGDVYVGCDIDFGAEVWRVTGAVDDVRFYDRVLTPSEILALATSP